MRRSPWQPTLALAATLGFGLMSSTPVAAGQVVPQPAAASGAPVATDQDLIAADRPGIADGSGVIARGRVQLEIGLQRDFRDEDATKTRASYLPSLVRIGLGAGVEARVETNAFGWIDTEDSTGTTRSSGWAPASVGAKYRFLDSSELHQPSLGIIGRVFPASGSGPFGTSRLTGDVRLAADLGVSRTVSLNPNVGIGRFERGDGSAVGVALVALTLAWQPSERISPFVDLAYVGRIDDESTESLLVDAGLAYIISPNIQLDVSYGTGAHGPGPRPFFSFGFSIRSRR